jgi:hypothetical protein
MDRTVAEPRRWYTGRMERPVLDADQREQWHSDGWCVLGLTALFPSAETMAAQLEARGAIVHAGP